MLGLGAGGGRVAAHRDTVAVCDDEKVLEVEGGRGRAAMQMYKMPLNRPLKKGKTGHFMSRTRACLCTLSLLLCPTLRDPTDCSP